MGAVRIIFLNFIFCLLIFNAAHAEEKSAALTLSPSDRLLIVAPHPDDDVIGAGGLIQEAVRLNIPVKIVYLTNGDSNSLAFLYYKKWPVLTSGSALEMGKLRRNEAVEAAGHLGLKKEDLVFLGYPDFGTLNMIKKYWRSAKPFRSILTRVSQVPYPLSSSYQTPYRPENILNDFKKLLKDFQPTKVFVTHPADDNPDHQAAFLFLQAAVWSLDQEIPPTEFLTYLVHFTGWPRPLGLHPDLRLDPPKYLRSDGRPWLSLELTAQEVTRKKEAVALHRSQIPYKPNYLFTFVRANELFCKMAPVTLRPPDPNEKPVIQEKKEKSHEFILKSVTYGLDNEKLHVRIHLGQKSLKNVHLDLYIFGYSKNVAFESMPKLNVKINQMLEFAVFDGKKRLNKTGVEVHRLGSDVLIDVPLKVIATPDHMMALVDLHLHNLPMQSTAWQTLEVIYDQ